MKIGTTTFGFRYLLLDPARAPELIEIVERARVLGLDVLQVCENARPMDIVDRDWETFVARAEDLGIEIQLGAKTTNLAVFRSCLERAARLPTRLLRLVFEEESGDPPTRAAVDRFLAAAWPLLDESGVRLAIENHFDVPSEVLAGAAAPYPASQVGFCVDTANSLRNFESPERVMESLGGRAFCYHLKDFRVDGDKLGFKVGGAPLGEGKLDVDWFLDAVFSHTTEPEIFLENWVPASGDWEADVREDDIWLRRSFDGLLDRLAPRGIRDRWRNYR